MERIDFRDQIAKNKLNSFFLMLSIVLFIVLIGYLILPYIKNLYIGW